MSAGRINAATAVGCLVAGVGLTVATAVSSVPPAHGWPLVYESFAVQGEMVNQLISPVPFVADVVFWTAVSFITWVPAALVSKLLVPAAAVALILLAVMQWMFIAAGGTGARLVSIGLPLPWLSYSFGPEVVGVRAWRPLVGWVDLAALTAICAVAFRVVRSKQVRTGGADDGGNPDD